MKKILVAEDDKFLASAYKVKLEKSGFEVRMAGDGEEAVEILKGFEPDVILLDLIMPKMDGFTALEQIRSNPKFARTPIMVASNLGQKEDIERAQKLGATGYIIKSDLSIEDLIKKINQVTN